MFSSHNVLGFSGGLASAGLVSSGLAWPYAGAPAATKLTAKRITPSHRVIRSSSMSDCAVPALAGPDPERVLERYDKHLAVANTAGPGGRGNQPDNFVRQAVRDDDLHLHFRQKVHRILVASIHLSVALLAAEAPDLGHGHADDARARERLLHVVELERLDDRLDFLHRLSRASNASAPAPSRSSRAPGPRTPPWHARASPARGPRDTRGRPSRARRGPPSRSRD